MKWAWRGLALLSIAAMVLMLVLLWQQFGLEAALLALGACFFTRVSMAAGVMTSMKL